MREVLMALCVLCFGLLVGVTLWLATLASHWYVTCFFVALSILFITGAVAFVINVNKNLYNKKE